jgi:hypothetical protein
MLLAGALFAALGLRLWGLDHGLPHNVEPDAQLVHQMLVLGSDGAEASSTPTMMKYPWLLPWLASLGYDAPDLASDARPAQSRGASRALRGTGPARSRLDPRAGTRARAADLVARAPARRKAGRDARRLDGGREPAPFLLLATGAASRRGSELRTARGPRLDASRAQRRSSRAGASLRERVRSRSRAPERHGRYGRSPSPSGCVFARTARARAGGSRSRVSGWRSRSLASIHSPELARRHEPAGIGLESARHGVRTAPARVEGLQRRRVPAPRALFWHYEPMMLAGARSERAPARDGARRVRSPRRKDWIVALSFALPYLSSTGSTSASTSASSSAAPVRRAAHRARLAADRRARRGRAAGRRTRALVAESRASSSSREPRSLDSRGSAAAGHYVASWTGWPASSAGEGSDRAPSPLFLPPHPPDRPGRRGGRLVSRSVRELSLEHVPADRSSASKPAERWKIDHLASEPAVLDS